jgi:hypothetical protein
MIRHIHDDGGRMAAGFLTTAGDCAVRAVAIASGRPYEFVYDELSRLENASPDKGVRSNESFVRWMDANGFRLIKQRKLVRLTYRRFKRGRYVVTALCRGMIDKPSGLLVGHAFAVIDGVVHDTLRPTPYWPVIARWKLA